MNKNKFWLFPLFLVCYEMCAYFSNDMYLPALPSLQRTFGITHHAAQYTLTAWFLGSAAFQLLLAPISEQFGRRPVLFLGGVVFVLANIVAASTSQFSYFLVARFFQGAALCSIFVAGYSAIHESFEHIKAIRTVAFMNSITIVAPAIGPLFGSGVLLFSSWRSIFVFLSVFSTLSLLALFFAMPETLAPNKRQKIQPSSVIETYLGVLKNRSFLLNTVSFCIVFIGLISWVSASAFVVMQGFHYSVWQYGLIQCVIFTCFILAARIIGVYVERYGVDAVIHKGFVLALLSAAVLLSSVLWAPGSLLIFLVPMMGYAFSTGLLLSTVQRKAIESISAPMGLKISLFFTLVGCACIVASILVGIFVHDTLLPLALIMFVCGFIAFLLRIRLKLQYDLEKQQEGAL